MKTRLFILTFLLVVTATAESGYAVTISELFDSVSKQPGVEISELAVKESRLNTKAVTAKLYPKLSVFGKSEIFNSPTNFRPMPPTEVNITAGESIPFSRNILRYGVTMEMPLFSSNLYILKDKLNLLAQKAEISNRINLTTRQARAVSLNSSFQYLVNLDQAVTARIKSLEKTRSDLIIKVNNGRTPEAELVKIDNSMIELSQQQNDIQGRILDVKQYLKQLTGLILAAPLKMEITNSVNDNHFIGVQKDELLVAAAEKEKKLRTSAYYPVISLYGSLSGNEGKAYNTNDNISRNYNVAGLIIQFPLFDKSLSTNSALAIIQLEKARKQLENTKIELQALSSNLQDKQPLVEKSIVLAKQSVKNYEELLKIARVSFNSGRTTTEEYLRYESQVLVSQASVNKTIDQKWQIITQQAVLYGLDLRGLIK